jgi:hypothetical protein
MNLKKYFNWKIVVGITVSLIVTLSLWGKTVLGLACPRGCPNCMSGVYRSHSLLIFFAFLFIITGSIMLILKILEQRILWIKRNKKKLSIIIISLSVACASIVILTTYFPVETTRIWSSFSEEKNFKNLEFEHHYLCKDKNCSVCGVGLNRADRPIVKWINDNELSIIVTTIIGTNGTTLKKFNVQLENNEILHIDIYENASSDCWDLQDLFLDQCSEFIIKGIKRNDYKGEITSYVDNSFDYDVDFEIYKEDAKNKPVVFDNIVELKNFCIPQDGSGFKDECENMPIEIGVIKRGLLYRGLYLYYPVNGLLQDGFYLYDRSSYDYDDLPQTEDKRIKIYAKQNLDLYYGIKKKVASLAGSKESVGVSIKGRVKSIESGPQDYPYNPLGVKLSIMLDDITYNEN